MDVFSSFLDELYRILIVKQEFRHTAVDSFYQFHKTLYPDGLFDNVTCCHSTSTVDRATICWIDYRNRSITIHNNIAACRLPSIQIRHVWVGVNHERSDSIVTDYPISDRFFCISKDSFHCPVFSYWPLQVTTHYHCKYDVRSYYIGSKYDPSSLPIKTYSLHLCNRFVLLTSVNFSR